MAYGKNLPTGLTPIGHLISGTCNININDNYLIDTSASAALQNLNFGDPVMISPTIADYAAANGYIGKEALITLYNPTTTLAQAGTSSTVLATNNNKTIAGVFQGCTFIDPSGMVQFSKYFVQGMQKAGTPVRATIIDDPFVIYSIQLGTYVNAVANAFVTQPVIFAAATGNNNLGGCVIGSNLEICIGGGTNLTTVNAAYANNPTVGANGTSAMYACPSLAATSANPSVANVANEYVRTNAALKLLGFADDDALKGSLVANPTYFNTPFLNVKVLINNHINKASSSTAILA